MISNKIRGYKGEERNFPINIGPRIYKNIDFLKGISSSKSEKRRQHLLSGANRDQLLAIIEIALNLLRFKFHLNRRERKRLIPFAEYIRKLARARSEDRARLLVNQKGAGAVIASVIIPVVAEVVRHLIERRWQKS